MSNNPQPVTQTGDPGPVFKFWESTRLRIITQPDKSLAARRMKILIFP
jgi:hypothetical protein